MARMKSQRKVKMAPPQKGEAINQHKKMAMGMPIPQPKPIKKPK